MEKEYTILHKTINIETEESDNQMILIFVKDKKIVSTKLITIPKWRKFYNETTKYYPPSLN